MIVNFGVDLLDFWRRETADGAFPVIIDFVSTIEYKSTPWQSEMGGERQIGSGVLAEYSVLLLTLLLML